METLQVLRDAFHELDATCCRMVIGSAVAAVGILAYLFVRRRRVKTIPLGDGWWGEGEQPAQEDREIHPFEVTTSDEEIQDLHQRIDRMRYTKPLKDSKFHYGFNSNYLKQVASYWRHQFDWKKQVAILNKYPHFKTNIEGLDVHFVHVRARPRPNQKVIPLMLVHGWPGCFFEFYKILPLLTEGTQSIVFEVVCPSIPGFGYSEAPHKQGFSSLDAARIFLKLMERLGFSQFYLQGGDFGSMVTTNMAQMKPECVKGLHLNMLNLSGGFKVLMSLLIGRYLPFLVGLTKEDVQRMFPFYDKCISLMLQEGGYLFIQATKPDTVGCGVNDSPLGLAAYILEKFSTATNVEYRDLEDGGLERKFSLDDLLTVIMIYWSSASIVSSMRFYKENMKSNPGKRIDAKVGIYVPTGVAAFPNEVTHIPKSWAEIRFRDIRSYTFMPSGGHFAAMEEPQLLANDVYQFVKKVEK
ncbi:epoxide hydrolase 1 [Synchiropus picturatus]